MSKRADIFFDRGKHIEYGLIEDAAKEIKAQPPTPTTSERPYSKKVWTPACQNVLRAYFSLYYSNLDPTYPEDRIVQRSSVKSTSGEVFELLAGKTFTLPPSNSYIAIPLAATGEVMVEAVVDGEVVASIDWLPGNMIYLKGTVGLRCLGKAGGQGSMICIILGLSYDGE